MKIIPSKKNLAISGAALVLAVALFVRLRSCDRQRDADNQTQTLAPNEEQKIIISPKSHQITIVTREKVKTVTLPDRPSSISLLKGDGLKVNAPQYGTEINPFVGVGYALGGGLVSAGLDLFYWKHLDAGLGLVLNPVRVQDTRAFVGVSYFVYSNTSLGIGADNQGGPLIFLKVRL